MILCPEQELVQGGDCEADVHVSVTSTAAGNHQGSRRGGGGREASGSLWSPRFPRAKEVGWWIVLGTEEGELLALKRVGTLGPRGYSTTLRFPSPEATTGTVPVVLHVVADGVMGMDRQARSTVTVS